MFSSNMKPTKTNVYILLFSSTTKRDAVAQLWQELVTEKSFSFNKEQSLKKRQSISGKIFIKLSLARFLNVDFSQIKLGRYRSGGYFCHDCPCSISISYSEANVAIAISNGSRVGIDIDRIRIVRNKPQILQNICSPSELEAINQDDELTDKTFLWVWTRKEAFAKAIGIGLAGNIKKLNILNPDSGKIISWWRQSGDQICSVWCLKSSITNNIEIASPNTKITVHNPIIKKTPLT